MLFQQCGVSLVADNAVFFEYDLAGYLARRGVIDFRAVFFVVFVVGGSRFEAVFVVEGHFSVAVFELAFPDQDAPFVIIVPRSVEKIVVEPAFSLKTAVKVICFVGTGFPAVDVGVFLAFAAVGRVHHFQSFDGVVHIDTVGVELSVTEIAPELAVAFAVFHLHFYLYRIKASVGTLVVIDGLAVLLFAFVLNDGLYVPVWVIGGFCVRAADTKQRDNSNNQCII